MHGGFLAIETNSLHPGLVRILESRRDPAVAVESNAGETKIRYSAYFDDASAGRMHAHTELRRRLVDIDAGLYRSDLVTAVAAIDASDLKHRLSYIDPDLAHDPKLTAAISERRRSHRLADRIWHAVGLTAILFLLFRLLLGL
jgi:hypothetical protein